jgi:hypothetical protein
MPDELEKAARRPRRKALTIAVLALAALAALTLVLYWMYPTWRSTRDFEVPKITQAHVDEEPFARVPLGPGESYRPIELMAGTLVEANCEVVSVTKQPRFRLSAFGSEQQASDCVFHVRIPDEIGRTASLAFEYRDGPAREPTDVLSVPVIVVGEGERIEFQGVENADGKPIDSVSAPDKVKVYAKAVTHLAGSPRDYVAMFFVADPIQRVPVLQILPMKEGETAPRAIVGQVAQYRRWGEALEGYAFWSPSPVTIGGTDEDRRVVDVYAGIFALASAPDVVAKSLDAKVSEDTVTLRPLLRDLDALRALTVGGRLLSPPLHLVRGPGSAEVGGKK